MSELERVTLIAAALDYVRRNPLVPDVLRDGIGALVGTVADLGMRVEVLEKGK